MSIYDVIRCSVRNSEEAACLRLTVEFLPVVFLLQARQLILQHGLTLSDLDRHPEVGELQAEGWGGEGKGSV